MFEVFFDVDFIVFWVIWMNCSFFDDCCDFFEGLEGHQSGNKSRCKVLAVPHEVRANSRSFRILQEADSCNTIYDSESPQL